MVTRVWLTEEQQVHWSTAAQESNKKLQNLEEPPEEPVAADADRGQVECPFSFFHVSEADFVVVIVMATIPGKMKMATRENPEERKAGDRDLVPSTTKEEQADANAQKRS